MKKGFTLIELLVVIAIIAILASIVMVSMSGARDKARDARLKGDLSQVRTLAELVNDDESNGYTNICSSTDNTLGDDAGSNYEAQLGTIQNDIDDQNSTTACYASADTYCISVELLSSAEYYCIDSSGIAVATGSDCSGTATGCNGQNL